MSAHNLFRFQARLGDGSVDADKGIITGVSMITSGVEAKGHDLEVDATTVEQLFTCAKAMKQVPVKTNHGTGADAVNGYLTNFRKDGDQLRADWHLLKNFTGSAHILEMAERMPSNVGLSVAFRGEPEVKKGGKKAARCEELVSTDLVASPAANPNGLFSAVDTPGNGMAKPTTTTNATAAGAAPGAEPTLADVLKAVTDLGGRIAVLEQGGGGDEDGDELTDEEIQEGLANGTLIEGEDGNIYVAEGGGEGEGGEGDGQGAGPQVEGVDMNNEAAVGNAGQAALARGDMASYLFFATRQNQLQLTALQRGLQGERQRKAREAEQTMFAEIEGKADGLVQLCAEQKEQLVAMSELLTEYQNGSKKALQPVGGGGESFHFDVVPEGQDSTVTAFESKVGKKFQELKAKGGITELDAKAQALKETIHADPGAYRQYLVKKGAHRA